MSVNRVELEFRAPPVPMDDNETKVGQGKLE